MIESNGISYRQFGEFTAHKDGYGNMVFESQNRTSYYDILTGQEEQWKGIITPEGRDATRGFDREKLLKHIVDPQHTYFPLPRRESGNESKHRAIYQYPYLRSKTWRDTIRYITNPNKPILAVEKMYNCAVENRLSGNSMAELFESIRPTIQKLGFNLIPLYGSNADSLFMPHIHGMMLSTYIDQLATQTKKSPVFQQVHNGLAQEIITSLRDEMRIAMNVFFSEYGFNNTDTMMPIYENTKGKKILALIDMEWSEEQNPGDNFMIPFDKTQGVYDHIAHGDVPGAIQQLKDSSLIIDPVWISAFKDLNTQ